MQIFDNIKSVWNLSTDREISFVRAAMGGKVGRLGGSRLTNENATARKWHRFLLLAQACLTPQKFQSAYYLLRHREVREELAGKIANLMHEVVQLEAKLAEGEQQKEVCDLIVNALKINDLSKKKRSASEGKNLEELEAIENEIEALDLQELKLLNRAKVKGEATLKAQHQAEEHHLSKEQSSSELIIEDLPIEDEASKRKAISPEVPTTEILLLMEGPESLKRLEKPLSNPINDEDVQSSDEQSKGSENDLTEERSLSKEQSPSELIIEDLPIEDEASKRKAISTEIPSTEIPLLMEEPESLKRLEKPPFSPSNEEDFQSTHGQSKGNENDLTEDLPQVDQPRELASELIEESVTLEEESVTLESETLERLKRTKPTFFESSDEVQIKPKNRQKPTLEEFQKLQDMDTFPLFSEKGFFNSLATKDFFYKNIILPVLNLLASCAAKTEKGEGSREDILSRWLNQLEKIKAKAEVTGSLYPKQFGKKLMRILYSQLSSWEEIGVIKNATMILKFIQDNKISVKELLKQLVSLSWPKDFVIQFDKIPSDDKITLCLEKFVKQGKLDDASQAIMSEVFPKEMASWPALFQIGLLALVAAIQSNAIDPESNKTLRKDIDEDKQMLGYMPQIIDWLKQLADLIPSGGIQGGAQIIAQMATAAINTVPYRKSEDALVEKLKEYQYEVLGYKAFEKDYRNIIRYCEEQIALYELVYPEKEDWYATHNDKVQMRQLKSSAEVLVNEKIIQREKKIQALKAELDIVKGKACQELEVEEIGLMKMVSSDLLQGLLGRHDLKPYFLFLFPASNFWVSRLQVACDTTDKKAMDEYQKQVCQTIVGAGTLLAQFANEILKNEEYSWLVNALDQILSKLSLPTDLMRTNLTDWVTTNILAPFALEEPKLITDEKDKKVNTALMRKPTLEEFKKIQGLDQAMSLPNLLTSLGKKGVIRDMMHGFLTMAASFAVKDVSSYLLWKETVPREEFVAKWQKELDGVIKAATVEVNKNVGRETPYEDMVYKSAYRGLEFLADSGTLQASEWVLDYIQKNGITASKILEEAKNAALPKTFSIPFAHLPPMSELPNILLDFIKEGKLNKTTEKLFKEHFPEEIAQWSYPLMQISLLFILSLCKKALDAIDTNEEFRSTVLEMPKISVPPLLQTIAEWSGWLAGGILEGGIRILSGWIESLPIPSAEWMIGMEIDHGKESIKALTEDFFAEREKELHADELERQKLCDLIEMGKKDVELWLEKNQKDTFHLEQRYKNIDSLAAIIRGEKTRGMLAQRKDYLEERKARSEGLGKQLEWFKTKSFKDLENKSHTVVKMVGQDLIIGLLQRHKLQPYIPLLFIPFRIAPALRAYADNPKDAKLRDALEKEINAGVTTCFTLFKRFATEIHDHKEYRWFLKALDDILANYKVPKDLMRTNWLQWLQEHIFARF